MRKVTFTNYVVERGGCPAIDLEIDGDVMVLKQLIGNTASGHVSRIVLSGEMMQNLSNIIEELRHEAEANSETVPARATQSNTFNPFAQTTTAFRATSGQITESGDTIHYPPPIQW